MNKYRNPLTLKFCELGIVCLALCFSCAICNAQQLATITGRVSTPNGSPPQNFSVALMEKDNGIVRYPQDIDYLRGTFTITNVQAGNYIVAACAGTDYAPNKQEVQVKEGKAQAGLSLILAPQHGRLSGNFGAGNVRVSAFFYGCPVASAVTDAHGRFNFKELPIPPDAYPVAAPGQGGRVFQTKPIPIKAGAEIRIKMRYEGPQGAEIGLKAEVINVPQDLATALGVLRAQIRRTPHLFSTPSFRLQTELLNETTTKDVASDILPVLYRNQRELSISDIESAALFAFASEEYDQASEFVTTGLNSSPRNKRLLAAKGLIQYGQSFYAQALTSFQAALPATPVAPKSEARATLFAYEGLTQWALGDTMAAESSWSSSSDLFGGDSVKQQQIYLLLSQADFYADDGDWVKATKLANRVLNSASALGSKEEASLASARAFRVQAKVALSRGLIPDAKNAIASAIEIHRKQSDTIELAADKDLLSDIEDQTGLTKQAVETLKEAAALYEKTDYILGQSENRRKLANLLIVIEQFDEAERLINEATAGFKQLNYQRGLGECETLKGVLILRRANHKYAERFNRNMSGEEIKTADRDFLEQTRYATSHFETAIRILQQIGYKRGAAYAQDKLAIGLVSLSKELPPDVFKQAEHYSKLAIDTFEQIGDKRGQAVANGNLGIVYRRNKQYELALRTLEKSLQICKEIEFKLGVGRQLFNLGRTFYEKAYAEHQERDLLKAKEKFLEAQKVLNETEGGVDELKLIDQYLKELQPN